MWSLGGLVGAVVLGVLAWRRSRQPAVNFYARDVYGMTGPAHLRYAYGFVVFAALFLAGVLWQGMPAVPLLAVFAVLAILYLASFVRGASGEDE